MVTRWVVAWVVAAVCFGAARAPASVQAPTAMPRPMAPPTDAVLDGTAPIDREAVAALARTRVRLGARWLAGVSRDDGRFFYAYDPADDQYEAEAYNEVRHAGVTYALYQAYELVPDDAVLAAAEKAAGYIAAQSPPVGNDGRAYVDPTDGIAKLGGQGLALVALLERRRVTGDTGEDELIGELGRFLLSLELPDEPGRYFFSYVAATGERLLTPDVVYYPGEALLALTRLAEHFPDGPWLAAATRAADYLVYRRDGDIPARGDVPRDDHWLTIALAELARLAPDDGYRAVVYLQADRMIDRQYTAADGYPARIGAARSRRLINYTSTATRGEAIVAAWALARFRGDDTAVARFSDGAIRTAQFQLRVQYTAENTQLYPDPDRLVGGWAGGPADPTIRIDYVQHNLSVLIGLWHLTERGDLPIAHA